MSGSLSLACGLCQDSSQAWTSDGRRAERAAVLAAALISPPQLLLVRNRDDCVTELPYDRLCIAVGARPRTLPQAAACGAADRVVTLRDTDSVSVLSHRLRDARRVMVAGNGGIAMELMCASACACAMLL